MAARQQELLSAYLFVRGTSESYLRKAQKLAKKRKSGVHFVFPLVGAWDSLIVLEAKSGDLEALRGLVTGLTDAGDGSRVPHSAVAIPWPLGRIKKMELPSPVEVIVAMRTRAGVSLALFDDLQAQLSPPDVEVLIERVNGSYDLVCELSGQDLESTQGAVERLRAAVGDRATVDVAFAAF